MCQKARLEGNHGRGCTTSMATRRFLKRHSWLSVCPVSNSRLFSASSGLYKSPPFQRAKRGPFYQDPPTLYNPFVEDVTTRSFLKRILPDKVCADTILVPSTVAASSILYQLVWYTEDVLSRATHIVCIPHVCVHKCDYL